jgi:hypothetical protein
MKRMTAVLLLFATSCLDQQAWPAEPSKPPELEVLRQFVGVWECKVVMNPAVWTPKEVREEAVEVNDMALAGWFLRGSSKTKDGKTRAMLMNTYDPVQKKFRIWRFTPGGSCEELTGEWNETTSTLTIVSDLGHGITSTAAFHLIDKDHREYRVVAKDSDGKVYLDIQGTVVRRK